MAVWEVDVDGMGTFQVESDTEPTADDVRAYFEQNGAPDVGQTNTADGKSPLLRDNFAGFKDYDELTGWSGDATAFYSSAANWGTIGGADLAMKYAAPEELETWKEARKANPVYSFLGGITGLTGSLFALGIPAMAGGAARAGTMAVGSRIGLNMASKGGKIAAGVSKYLAEGAALVTQEATTKTIDAVAGTESFDDAKNAWSNFAQKSAFYGAMGAAGEKLIVPAVKYAFSPSYRAMTILTPEALSAGKRAYLDAIALGQTEAEAANIGQAAVLKALPEKKVEVLMNFADRYPDFREALIEQIVGKDAKGIVVNTQKAMTGAQTAEYSKVLNDNLYGPGYQNQLGATSPDFTLGGLLHSMGLSAESGYAFTKQAGEVRSAALKGAQDLIDVEVANTGAWGGAVKAGQIGKELESLLGQEGYDAFITKIAQNRMGLARRMTPEATKAAEAKMNAEIQEIAEMLMMNAEAGTLSGQQALQMAAKEYVNGLVKNGTNDIYTLDNLLLTVRDAFPKQVEEGLGSVYGRYKTRIINEVLDNPIYVGTDAKGLFMTNQSLRWSDDVVDIYSKAYEFSGGSALGKGLMSPQTMKKGAQTDIDQLLDYLNQGINAQDTVIRKAIFKGAMTNRFLEATKAGNSAEAAKIKSWISDGGDLVKAKIFRPGEFNEYYGKIKPEIQAARKIEAIYRATNNGAMSVAPSVAEATAKSVSAFATAGATANATRLGIQSFWSTIKFGGPKTAQRVTEYLQNPSWANFNAMVDSAEDAVSKTLMQQMVSSAVKNAAETGVGEASWWGGMSMFRNGLQ